MVDDGSSAGSALSRFRLPVKLGIGFGVVLALTGLLGAVALVKVASLRDAAGDLATDQVVSAQLLGAMDAASGQFRVAQLQEIVGDDAAAATSLADMSGRLQSLVGRYTY